MGFSSQAAYKKAPGTLRTTEGDKTILWSHEQNKKAPVVISVLAIQGVQATAPGSANNILRVTINGPEGVANHSFSFSSRQLLDETKLAVQNLVQVQRNAEAAAKAEAAKQAAAAKEAASMTREEIDMDSKSLLQNHSLQQKLLKDNKELMKTFQEAVIQGGLSVEEFWNTRIVMLRSFAFSSTQRRGRYNVFSTIKPTVGDNNQLNVSLSREKIHDIFEQYPIVRRAYDDNVPEVHEGQFWGRFFNSRLYRKLKGEKIGPNDAVDTLLDKYLTLNEEAGMKRKAEEEESYHVPQYLDIEGNEENSSEKLGNRPDITMIPGKSGKDTMSLIRAMNQLSQKMLNASTVKPVDDENDLDLDRFLKLSDLGGDEGSITAKELHLKERYVEEKNNATTVDKLNSAQSGMKSALTGAVDLTSVTSNHEEVLAARDQVTDTIRLRALEGRASSSGLEFDRKLMDAIQICHATSIEFLRHFWIHFQSGDPNQAPAITKLIPSLKRSIDRVNAVVAQGATPDEQERIRKALHPIVDSLTVAIERYNAEIEKLP